MGKSIEETIKNTTEKNQNKTDWTKAWSSKYKVLKEYQQEVDIPKYSKEIRRLLNNLENEYNYSKEDAVLVLKDILYHEYKDKM